MAITHQSVEWPVDAEVDVLHQQGLARSIAFELNPAREAYQLAETMLDDAPQSPAGLMQHGRVQRDHGFTYTREVVAATTPTQAEVSVLVDQAREKINASITDFNQVINWPHALVTGAERADVIYERGASRSLLGRTAMAKQVALGEITDKPPTKAQRKLNRAEKADFGKRAAHKDLKEGSRSYELVSNAMYGAQSERLDATNKAELAYMLPWLGRAAVGLMTQSNGKTEAIKRIFVQTSREIKNAVVTRHIQPRTSLHNIVEAFQKTDAGASLLTATRIFIALRSRRAALASVKARP